MHLVPREIEKLWLHQAGVLAQKRLARGLRLNYPEATALLSCQLLELIRDGPSVADLMSTGKKILARCHVLPGVEAMLHEVQVEGTFEDGTKLVTVHNPICQDALSAELALHGSFLPIPDGALFEKNAPNVPTLAPGEVLPAEGDIELQPGRERRRLEVTNTGDRPIQVGSHYPFVETNSALAFEREGLAGFRLDIPAGTAVRFEPGDQKTITLVAISPTQPEGKADGSLSHQLRRIRGHLRPHTGDRIQLGNTGLIAKVERDLTHYGDECKFGGGKVLRDRMGQRSGAQDADALDTVITNALIVDVNGIYKADIGIKYGRIVAIGKAGNPEVMPGVHPLLHVGVTTEAIAGEGLLCTAGGMDAHVHFICPQLVDEALASGITTFVGGGTGPATGTNATTCTPGIRNIELMLQACDAFPINIGLTGKGNSSHRAGLDDQIRAGAIGLKLHEDWGTTPSAIDSCLKVADEFDVQVTIHTYTLNESGYVDDSLAAIAGRTIHTYHSEGAGGGHAPDILRVCGEANVLPSSTNPTRPYTVNTLDEHLDMLMVCHHLDKHIPEDVSFAESRIRGETIAAEDILHDLGAISIIASDSQAMGRVGEVICRTWQTAAKMKAQRGPLPEDNSSCDNFRIRRYIAKYTINPAIAHGMAAEFGSIAEGKWAVLVLWKPAFFGSRPEIVIKGGMIAWAQMGDGNASIPTPEPRWMRPMFGAHGRARGRTSLTFVSKAALAYGKVQDLGLEHQLRAIESCRSVNKSHMQLNSALPKLEVDPETYQVRADGVRLTCEPAERVPLGRLYSLF